MTLLMGRGCRTMRACALVALGWLVAAGATAGCDIAQADAGVGAYLNDLEDSGIGGDTSRLVNIGEGACHSMRSGWTPYSAPW
jgi:hypothetical protein